MESKNEIFIEKAKLKHSDSYDYSLVDYINNKTNVKIICPLHGIFEQRPNNHLSGSNCYKCGKNSTSGKLSTSKKLFIIKAKIIHGDRYDYSLVDYINNKTNIKIICSIHGEFEQVPSNHLSGSICNKCGYNITSNKLKLSNDDFIIKAKTIHGNKYDYFLVDYKSYEVKIKIICPTHGEFEQRPSSHLSGSGCPICKESKGEKEIREFLIKNKIIFITQHTFTDCKNIRPLPFDFYLPELNTCIEFNGRQHYESIKWFGGQDRLIEQQTRDKLKENYCLKNNINLIIIKHNNSIEDRLTLI